MARGKYALRRDEEIKKLRRDLEKANHKERVASENLEATRLALNVSRQNFWNLKKAFKNLKHFNTLLTLIIIVLAAKVVFGY